MKRVRCKNTGRIYNVPGDFETEPSEVSPPLPCSLSSDLMRPLPNVQPARDLVDAHVGAFVLDKHGREIKPGDVLKVWHFIGRRRKVHYMYKWVLREELLGEKQTPFLRVSHLTTGNVEDGYWIQKDGSKLDEYEIVAGFGRGYKNGDFDPFDERPIRCPNDQDQS